MIDTASPPIAPRDLIGALRADFSLGPRRDDAPLSERSRPAAVLCPVVRGWDGLNVVLTRRATHLRAHAGQISFPGGKIDAGDRSPLAAALREAEEEIGLYQGMVDVIGALDPYRTRTGFAITPFIGLVDPRFRPTPQVSEVAEVFQVPLDFLMNPANISRESVILEGRKRNYYAIPYNHYYIWGATAGMLVMLSQRIERFRASDGRSV